MPTVSRIRGAILEEIVLALLHKAGYRILDENDGEEIKDGPRGLELRGRGEWHQVDALVGYDFTPAFIYPIRLIVEAKAYLPTGNNKGKVGINVVRNAVGVLKDVNEDYFSYSLNREEYKIRRFNYTYAIFSLYGFTQNAQRYAIAHQIFLIQYYYMPLFQGLQKEFSKITEKSHIFKNLKKFNLKAFRKSLRKFLKNEYLEILRLMVNFLFKEGIEIMKKIKKEVDKIGGSYFGLLNGEYPIHILSQKPIRGIESEEEVYAEIRIREAKYVELTFRNNKLYFELPELIAELSEKIWENKISFIALTGFINNIRRSLIIKLDEKWLRDYLEKLKNKTKELIL